MTEQARRGRRVLIILTVLIALGEIVIAVADIQKGRYGATDLTRLALTMLLFWQVWDGARWARFLLAALCLGGVVMMVVWGITAEQVPAWVVVAAVAVLVLFYVSLISAPIGAYQAYRRSRSQSPDTTPATPEQDATRS